MKQFVAFDGAVEVEVYGENKYIAAENGKEEVFENSIKVKYSVIGWEIVGGEDAREIEAETDLDGMDDNHEYLVIYLVNGETATFRNSYVDMWCAR